MHNSRTIELEIEKMVYRGSGLGRCGGKVVFVPFSAPGDRLRVRTVREKKDYITGTIQQVLTPAPGRVTPPCPYFGKCGGCQLQHLEYPLQVEAKKNILSETLHHRFPGARSIPVSMEECPQPFAYRSRARVQLPRSGGTLSPGFFRYESHAVEAIDNCMLLRPPLNRALRVLRRFEPGAGLSPDIRELDIAGSFEEDRWTASPAGMHAGAPASVPEAWNPGAVLKRKVGDFAYSVTASAFFQANDFMILPLVEHVREMAEGGKGSAALDLFAGAGLFSLPLAGLFDSVIAVEQSSTASELCAANARAAGAGRVQTVCSEVGRWLESQGTAAFDLILLDPPRSGAGARIMERIRSLASKTIIYVSCDPQTLVRDLEVLCAGEYAIDRVMGLDMFPQTFHFETIIRLKLLSNVERPRSNVEKPSNVQGRRSINR